MTQQLTEPLLRRHESLRPKVERVAEVARDLPLMELEERRAAVTEIVGFLGGELRLHAEAEENWLYPEIALQLRHPFSLAGMAFDHKLLAEQIEALQGADIEDTAALQEVLFGIYTTLDVHFRKEEEVYLPMLEYEYEEGTVASIAESMERYERGEPPVAHPDIDLDRHEFPVRGLPIEKLAYFLRYAILAPSSHNSQPWRFRLTDGGRRATGRPKPSASGRRPRRPRADDELRRRALDTARGYQAPRLPAGGGAVPGRRRP